MVYTRLVQHSTLTFGQKMKELANVIREYENELIQKMKDEKGISFCIVSEKQAEKYLFNVNNFCSDTMQLKKGSIKFFKEDFPTLSNNEILDLLNLLYPENVDKYGEL